MKATLEFNLPEENYDHLCAVHGHTAILVLFKILNAMREELKYNVLTDEQYTIIEGERSRIIEIIDEYGLMSLIEQ